MRADKSDNCGKGDHVNLSWIIQLIAGAIGGNSAGAALKQFSLGPIGNTIAGLLGGVGGGQLLGMIIPALSGAATSAAGATGGGMDIGAMVGQLVGGGVSGAVITLIVGFIKQKMSGATAKT
jgi:hypothetical protein